MATIAIEHLEDNFSIWLVLEYINAAENVDCRLIYTNVRSERVRRILSRYAPTYRESIFQLYDLNDLIILDPMAEKTLESSDAMDKVLVIGGILGDHPPRGRTFKTLTNRVGMDKARNLGRSQMSIDSAAYVACRVAMGRDIEDITYVDGLTLKSRDSEVYLPYRYPVAGDKIIMSPAIKKIVEAIGIFHEYWLRTL